MIIHSGPVADSRKDFNDFQYEPLEMIFFGFSSACRLLSDTARSWSAFGSRSKWQPAFRGSLSRSAELAVTVHAKGI